MRANVDRKKCFRPQFTIQGLLRGCGRQALDAIIVASGIIISLVMGITLMLLTSMDLMGKSRCE